jgi:hypothetical protein
VEGRVADPIGRDEPGSTWGGDAQTNEAIDRDTTHVHPGELGGRPRRLDEPCAQGGDLGARIIEPQLELALSRDSGRDDMVGYHEEAGQHRQGRQHAHLIVHE